jgi:hypothetical protein
MNENTRVRTIIDTPFQKTKEKKTKHIVQHIPTHDGRG